MPGTTRGQIDELVGRFQQKRARTVIIMATGRDHPAIDASCVERLGEVLPYLPKGKGIDLIVNSDGGDASAAYHLASVLQWRSKDIVAFVPRKAKSAATLICLAAQQIRMGPLAELGPLDPQVSDPRDPHAKTSALNGYMGLNAVSAFYIRLYKALLATLKEESPLRVADAMSCAASVAAPAIQTLLKQSDPMDLGRFSQALRLGEQYGKRLLLNTGLLTSEEVDTTMELLVYEYPHHSFVIRADEARGVLKLPAIDGHDDVDDLALEIVEELEDGARFTAFPLPRKRKKKTATSTYGAEEKKTTKSSRQATSATAPQAG